MGLRIAFVTDCLGMLAGTEASLVDTAIALSQRGGTVLVAHFNNELPVHVHWRAVLRKREIRLVEAEAGEDESTFCARISNELRRWLPDVVHFLPLGRLAASWIEAGHHQAFRCVGTETSEASRRCTWYDASLFGAFQELDAIVATCETAARGVRTTFGFGGRVETLPPVLRVPDAEIRVLDASALASIRRLGSITRLRVEKGPEFLVAALAMLAQTHDVTLTIHGEVPELERTREVATALEVSDRLIVRGPFLGHEEINSVIEPHALFLLSSLFEGLPLAVLAAMARGRITVATDVGGVKAVLRDVDPGCVVPVADPRAMAAAVAALLEDPDRVLADSARSVELFRDRYHVDVVVPRLERFYHEISS